ncbi:hypothetical protein ACHAXR_007532 [Thalassiosira sp. AJA248-18]
MARGRNSHHGGGGSAILACNRAIDHKDAFERSVKDIHARTKMIAEIMRPDSNIDRMLKECDGADADDWLMSCHNRLKAIGEGNVKRMNEIEYFVDGVKEVRTEVERRQNENQGGEEEDAVTDAPDYERSINEAVDRIRQQRENNQSRVAPEDHYMSTEIREALGEKIQKKRSRASRGGDDDDDLEIVQNRVEDARSFKCPITGMFFENPVKNKVCHHTYDRAGLDQLLRANKHTCPVPGCANKAVTLAQVEEDVEMKLKVKRHKTREEAEKRKRDLEEDDEDDGQEGGGYTVL